MGRATQIITYLNLEKYPTGLDIKHQYTHVSIDEKTKLLRKKYKKDNKKLIIN